jgi:hypothetical protein
MALYSAQPGVKSLAIQKAEFSSAAHLDPGGVALKK